MKTIEITLPDGSSRSVQAGVSLQSVAAEIGKKLAQDALAAEVDGKLLDLTASLDRNAAVRFVTFDSDEGRDLFWHSSAHLMAQAVIRLFPEARYTIGPSIDTGFYYDFDCPHTFTPDDLAAIEAEMEKIVKEDIPVTRRVVSRDEAVALFSGRGNQYKVEIVSELPPEEEVSLYEQGDFVDLCRGPHVPSTGYLKAFKLTALAGAYWRGNENNAMLQRIYGVAFPDRKELKQYLLRIEEAKKRDHRRIGKELDLFSFHEEGPGFPFWHGKGMVLFNELIRYMQEENRKRGYSEIRTPSILNEELWHRSGHWANYKDNMYFTDIDEQRYAIKPMNCPGGLLIYRNSMHSYRELPLRNAEMGMVHRHELSGVLHGLFRVRSFTQDDAHIFCMPEQLRDEVRAVIDYTLEVYRDFGFEQVDIFVATRPEKAIGSDSDWELATAALKDALAEAGMSYKIKAGEGAFYGPKIEFNIKDCLGRNWQCGTVQVDFSMPLRFELTYRGSDGKDHTPVMVHRAILGSFERFVGILTEHYAGKFPFWLAPVQLALLTVNDHVKPYGEEVAQQLEAAGFRVERGFNEDTLGNKIRLARNNRIPYILIIGEKEAEEKTVSVKTYNNENRQGIPVGELVARLRKAAADKEQLTILADYTGGIS